MIVGSGLARLIAEAAAHRLSGPRLQNTDGDPMALVKATLAVDDLDAVTVWLAEHPDIQPDEESTRGLHLVGPHTHRGRARALAGASCR